MKWYAAIFYVFISALVLALILGLLTILLKATNIKGRSKLFGVALARIISTVLFIIWAAVMLEFSKQINLNVSSFVKTLIVFIPTSMIAMALSNEGLSTTKEFKEGSDHLDISATIMNSAGIAIIAYIAFWIFGDLNNTILFDMPKEITNTLFN